MKFQGHIKDSIEDKKIRGEIRNENYFKTEFTRVFAIDAIFVDTSFKQSNFSRCNFHNCRFMRCDFTGANIKESKLMGCQFEDCNFRYTTWEKTYLEDHVLDTW